MFKKLFGMKGSRKEELANKKYNKALAELFNTPEGHAILAWIVKTQVIEMNSSIGLKANEMAYYNGRLDFIRFLVSLTDFDFTDFMKDHYGEQYPNTGS